jgi:hypothetical protein
VLSLTVGGMILILWWGNRFGKNAQQIHFIASNVFLRLISHGKTKLLKVTHCKKFRKPKIVLRSSHLHGGTRDDVIDWCLGTASLDPQKRSKLLRLIQTLESQIERFSGLSM